MKIKWIIGAIALWATASANAAVISSLVGDKDCFGTDGACIEDGSTWLPGGWGSVVAEGDDPTFTDRVYNTSAEQSWDHSLAAGSYTWAILDIRTAGIADIAGPIDVFIDGILAGSMPLDGYGHILVETFSFAFDVSLIADGFATVSFTPASSGDSWAIDYAEIRAEYASVPEPGSLFLMALGLIGLGLSRRKPAVQ